MKPSTSKRTCNPNNQLPARNIRGHRQQDLVPRVEVVERPAERGDGVRRGLGVVRDGGRAGVRLEPRLGVPLAWPDVPLAEGGDGAGEGDGY